MIIAREVINLDRNPKQSLYFEDVMRAVKGETENRFFAFGGAVRGGKTFVTLFILILLCKMFPGSRWHVIRASLPDLKKTTIPSFEKLAPAGVTIHRDPGNWYASFENGSKIFFTAESASHDPELKSFLGLETNGIFIEQAEEASNQLWDRAMERTGSWYIDPMPPGLIFTTFNPTEEWPKAVFYDPFKEGKLESPYYYLPALPTDNPFVTDDQWNTWAQMDSKMYAAMIEGDWDALISKDGRAFWTFEKTKHVADVPFLPDIPVVHLTFDFNVVPYMTLLCIQCQYLENGALQVRVFREICPEHPRATTKHCCEDFLTEYGTRVKEAYIYGDASGNRRDTRAQMSDFDIAMNTLRAITSNRSLRVKRANPEIRKRVAFVRAILEGKIPGAEILIDKSCENLIKDFVHVKTDANGGKLKEKKTVNGVQFEPLCHATDAFEDLITTIFEPQYKAFERLLQ